MSTDNGAETLLYIIYVTSRYYHYFLFEPGIWPLIVIDYFWFKPNIFPLIITNLCQLKLGAHLGSFVINWVSV